MPSPPRRRARRISESHPRVSRLGTPASAGARGPGPRGAGLALPVSQRPVVDALVRPAADSNEEAARDRPGRLGRGPRGAGGGSAAGHKGRLRLS